ncbi:IPT/TIG domain-containing protein [Pseudoalteromonas denitrificans]|uniref:IPT/TIG domain-containing protein n=1 Tax=Pseudoalteromonas denitrificans DSM 6059 TaxID=1123010 RepID=A0A1I1N3E1_9GAMM|nr:IPT/TIG domain-containing protein [Pseudoalteromonas denitrificans]SFC91876.1 hypothetical protein SAMN02745724_02911 [Pseudoalteromonas denitrificans DSM 6059]
MKLLTLKWFYLIFIILLSACGGGGSSNSEETPTPTPNQSPTANAGDDQNVDENILVTLNGLGTDADGSIASFSWTQTSGDAVVLTDAGLSSASFTAPNVTTDQTLIFNLMVTDNGGATANDTINVNVKNINQLPIANAGPDASINEFKSVTLDASLSSDPDGTISSFIWSQVDNGTPTITLTNHDQVSASFIAPDVASSTNFEFEVTVTDNDLGVSKDNVIITVLSQNPEPIANAGLDRRGATSNDVANGVANIFIDGSASSGLNFQWSVSNMPANATYRFTSAENPITGFIADVIGDYELELTVDNGQNSVVSDKTIITMISDSDADGLPDTDDSDRDGDGFNNTEDLFPDNKAAHLDNDLDGTGNYYNLDEDGDGVVDILDDFPLDNTKVTMVNYSEQKETENIFNQNDGISVSENVGVVPIKISGYIRSNAQSPDLDYFKIALKAGVYSILLNEVKGDLKASMNLVTASGERVPTIEQTFFDGKNKKMSIALIPNDGDYYLIVADSSGKSGDDWSYDLTVQSDSDRDGINDQLEKALDLNHLSSDSDGDSISDLIELNLIKENWQALNDSDQDGLPIWWDTDTDGDSIPDSIEYIQKSDYPELDDSKIAILNDVDQDSILNFMDLDSDGNGVLDKDEIGEMPFTPLDTDNDNIPDFIDLDNDADGLADTDESNELMNNPLGQDEAGDIQIPLAEQIGIISIVNTNLELENVCRSGDLLSVTGIHLPSVTTSLWGVFQSVDASNAVHPVSINDNIATFECPQNIVSGTIEFYLALGDTRSDSKAIQSLVMNTAVLTSAGYDNTSKIVTLGGTGLNTNITVQLAGASLTIDNSFGSAAELTFTLPTSAKSGFVNVSSINGESNAIWLSVQRTISGSVNLPANNVTMSDVDIGFMEAVLPDAQGNFNLDISSQGNQTIVAIIQTSDSTVENPKYAPYLSAVTLAGESQVELSAATTALALIWDGIGINQLVNESQQVSAKTSIAGLPEVISLAEALEKALVADPYALNFTDTNLVEINKAALLATANWVATNTSSTNIFNRNVELEEMAATVVPTEADDISVYERSGTGNVNLENDTQLYLSVKITTTDGQVLQKHITGLNGMAGPQGLGLLFWASTSEFSHPGGKNATVEVITAGIDKELSPHVAAPISVWRKLFFRTWIERVIWPVIGEYLSVIDASTMTNIIVSAAPALVDTVTTKVLSGDATGAMKDLLNFIWGDFASAPPGPITTALAKRFGKNIGEEILKKVAAKIGAKFVPGIGQVALAFEVAGHVNNGLNAGKAVKDVLTTDQVLHFEVSFPLQVESVAPTKVKSNQVAHTFVLEGEGFSKIKRGIWPFDYYLEPEITFTSANGSVYKGKASTISQDGESMAVDVPAWFFSETLEGPLSVEVHHPTDEDTAKSNLKDAIEVVQNLELTSLSPDKGGNDEEVTIYGAGFSSAINMNEVMVGGKVTLVTAVSTDTLKIIIPDGLDAGTYDVLARVQNDGVWSDWAGPLQYEVLQAKIEITVCDSGNLKDDAFALYVDGKYLGTMNATNSNYCNTYRPTLSEGSHTAVLIGVEAPDSVGTYSIDFTGVSNLSGSSTSGTDLTPGVSKLYSFDVSVTSLMEAKKSDAIRPNILQEQQQKIE